MTRRLVFLLSKLNISNMSHDHWDFHVWPCGRGFLASITPYHTIIITPHVILFPHPLSRKERPIVLTEMIAEARNHVEKETGHFILDEEIIEIQSLKSSCESCCLQQTQEYVCCWCYQKSLKYHFCE
jgi:hypothetical protein